MPAGAMADASRDARKQLYYPAIISSSASMLMMTIFYMNRLLPWHIYIIVFIMSSSAVFRDPMVDRIINVRLKAKPVSMARYTAWFQFCLGASETLAPLIASVL